MTSKRSLENSFSETIGGNESRTGSLEPVEDYQSIHIIAYSQQEAILTLQYQVAGQSFPSGLIESIVDLEPEQLIDFNFKPRGSFFRIKYENLSSSSSVTKIETFYSNRVVLEADSDNVQIKALDEDGNLTDIRTDTSGNLKIASPPVPFISDDITRGELVTRSIQHVSVSNNIFGYFVNNNSYNLKIKKIKLKITQQFTGNFGRPRICITFIPDKNFLDITQAAWETQVPTAKILGTSPSDAVLLIKPSIGFGGGTFTYIDGFPADGQDNLFPNIYNFIYQSTSDANHFVETEVLDTVNENLLMPPDSAIAFDLRHLTANNSGYNITIHLSYERAEL